MSEDQWTRVAKEEELAEGKPISVKVGKSTVLIVRQGDNIHACGGKCSHYGGPLAEGLLMGDVITCPWHSARFDVRTGQMVSPPGLDDVGCYAVKVEDGEVYVGEKEEAGPPEMAGEDGRTFVIVGAGAAGNAAAETLRREGFAGRILLVTGEPHRPYDRPTLSKDLMSGEASAKWLPLHKSGFYDDWQIELLTERRVASLDPEGHTLALADGEQIGFDCALLATGGVPRRLDIPGVELEGCFLLRSREDAQAILTALEDAQNVVLLGAGFIGLEVASHLLEREREPAVHVVAPEELPMLRLLGEDVARWLFELHQEHGVKFHLGTTAKELRGDGKVEEVVLADGTPLAADVVIVAIGVRPAVEYLEGSGLVEDGAVPVDGTLKTRADGIYAAGDMAAVPDPRSGQRRRIEHWIVAERQGQHAARAMLGSAQQYEEVPFFWTMQCGKSLKYVGYADDYDQVVLRGSLAEGKFVAGYYSGQELKAAAGVGRADDVLALGELLRAGVNVPPEKLRDQGVDLRELVPQPDGP